MADIQTQQMGQSNPVLCSNSVGVDGNPTSGYAHGVGMCIAWQDGPRGKNPDGTLGPATGAFVEDALVAAKQRLEFFQRSKYACEENQSAIDSIAFAIDHLARRAGKRAERGVLGQHAV